MSKKNYFKKIFRRKDRNINDATNSSEKKSKNRKDKENQHSSKKNWLSTFAGFFMFSCACLPRQRKTKIQPLGDEFNSCNYPSARTNKISNRKVVEASETSFKKSTLSYNLPASVLDEEEIIIPLDRTTVRRRPTTAPIERVEKIFIPKSDKFLVEGGKHISQANEIDLALSQSISRNVCKWRPARMNMTSRKPPLPPPGYPDHYIFFKNKVEIFLEHVLDRAVEYSMIYSKINPEDLANEEKELFESLEDDSSYSLTPCSSLTDVSSIASDQTSIWTSDDEEEDDGDLQFIDLEESSVSEDGDDRYAIE